MQKIKFLFSLLLVSVPGILTFFFLSFLYAGEPNLVLRMYGRVAMIYLTLTLMVSPIAAYISNKPFRERFIHLRKLLGLAGFSFFLAHMYQYVIMEYGYHGSNGFLSYFFGNVVARPDAFSWVIAGISMLILWLTSNGFSMQKLWGKRWKTIQNFAYPLFLLSLIHVAFASRFDLFYGLLAVILVLTRTVSYLSFADKDRWEIGKVLYICIPCGYIYDEDIGDPDSGIPSGTRFEDIPDTWRCPVCGVTKADFEVLGGGSSPGAKSFQKHNEATIVSARKLTDDVIEIVLVPDMPIISKPWQFVTIGFEDGDGLFHRSYSIISNKSNKITLAIKRKPDGRGSKRLALINISEKVKIAWAYGKFLFRNTWALSVFIATGTGLSPILSFLESTPEQKKVLYIGAQTASNLFYMDRIAKIPNLETHVYLSREQNPKYKNWRINVAAFTYPSDTNFYICGNPALIADSRWILLEKGYKNIFYESFNV